MYSRGIFRIHFLLGLRYKDSLVWRVLQYSEDAEDVVGDASYAEQDLLHAAADDERSLWWRSKQLNYRYPPERESDEAAPEITDACSMRARCYFKHQ